MASWGGARSLRAGSPRAGELAANVNGTAPDLDFGNHGAGRDQNNYVVHLDEVVGAEEDDQDEAHDLEHLGNDAALLRSRSASFPAGAHESLQRVANDGAGATASTASTRVSSPRGSHWHVIIKARTRLHNSQRVARKILYYDGKPGSSFSVGRSQSCDLRLDDDRCAALNALIHPVDEGGVSGIRLQPRARMYELVGPSRRNSSEAVIQVGSVIKVGSVSLEVTDLCTKESDDFVERFAQEINTSSSGRASIRSGDLQDNAKEGSSSASSKHDADSDGSVEGGASNEEADTEADAHRHGLADQHGESDDELEHRNSDHGTAAINDDDDDDEPMCYICWGGPDVSLTEDAENPEAGETSTVDSDVHHLTRQLEEHGRRPDGLRANPLIQNPCGKCSGSSRYVHLNCLLTWIKSSGSGHCSICNGPLPQHFSSPPPNIELKVVRHRRGQSWVGTRRFRLSFADRSEATIGRDVDADVRLGDRSVGSIHARLRFDHETREFRLSDCNSLGGTYLQVKSSIDLAPDVPVNLKIGRTQLTLRMTEKRSPRYNLPNPLVAWKR
ncbi:E3 ubiquitin-protein ligase MARCH11 [Hondaea fermentalgiana]|uniref:E3 ubiquitin-protein ligase MARCH11 n=1 Tax=Hondaea fermentalgiana TaxID=2315210 RepID=A0A2R5GEQ5_9STRA|nr:E3 ubiquitin-protein ligase MARCH11 [Hondaea fermentalgiana]|eukprot:GBG29420.1 E3 ubiquitin-protein ligase MARCH11 [Hondaea fermentalgiana]